MRFSGTWFHAGAPRPSGAGTLKHKLAEANRAENSAFPTGCLTVLGPLAATPGARSICLPQTVVESRMKHMIAALMLAGPIARIRPLRIPTPPFFKKRG